MLVAQHTEETPDPNEVLGVARQAAAVIASDKGNNSRNSCSICMSISNKEVLYIVLCL